MQDMRGRPHDGIGAGIDDGPRQRPRALRWNRFVVPAPVDHDEHQVGAFARRGDARGKSAAPGFRILRRQIASARFGVPCCEVAHCGIGADQCDRGLSSPDDFRRTGRLAGGAGSDEIETRPVQQGEHLQQRGVSVIAGVIVGE